MKKQREEKAATDLLTECARVFLFSLAKNAGDDRPYAGALRCSGDEEEHPHGS